MAGNGIFDNLFSGGLGQGTGLLGLMPSSISDAFGGQRGMMSLALGLMSGDTPMEGARNALGAFQKTTDQDQLRKVLIAQKMDPAMANAVVNNPEVLKAVLTGYAKPVDFQHITVGDTVLRLDPRTGQFTHAATVPKTEGVDPEKNIVTITQPPPILPGQTARPPMGGAPNIMQGTPGALPTPTPSPAPPAPIGPMGGLSTPLPPPRPSGLPPQPGMLPQPGSPQASINDRFPTPQPVSGATPVPIQAIGRPSGGSVQTEQLGVPKAPPGYTGGPKNMAMIPNGPAYNEALAKMADDFRQEKLVQNYQTVIPVIQSIREAEKTKGGAADLNIVYGVAKIFDPGSVVREGEQTLVRQTPGIPDRIWGMIEAVKNGQQLDADARRYLIAEAESRVRAASRAHDQVVSYYVKRAQSMGIDPGKIIYSLENQVPVRSWTPDRGLQ